METAYEAPYDFHHYDCCMKLVGKPEKNNSKDTCLHRVLFKRESLVGEVERKKHNSTRFQVRKRR